MRILVAGSFAHPPGFGGGTWAVLQYLVGLERLGHDVRLVDPCPAEPATLAYHRCVVDQLGLGDRALLVHPGRRCTGAPYAELAAWSRRADVLLNLAGVLTDAELVGSIPCRVYLDLDPAFTQLWQADGIDMRLGGHHRFATVGLGVGGPGWSLPDAGVEWTTTVPPVVLDEWPRNTSSPRYGVTTVANWRSYGPVSAGGVNYGQKAHSMRDLIGLPCRLPAARFEPALAIHAGETADRAGLAAHGWRLLDPAVTAGSPALYRAFVRHSAVELGVAKSGYVLSRSGWFSDRSVCYLASGRPVVAQETGWSSHLPSGQGLVPFGTVDDAAAALTEVLSDYDRHARAARQVAEDVFDARIVLSGLLAAVGAA